MLVNIIIPNYNEEATIGFTLEYLIRNIKLDDYRIIVVDDASLDNSLKIIEGWCRRTERIEVIKNKEHKGYVEVLKQGFSRVDSDELILTFMADASDDVQTIRKMYKKIIEEGFDLVGGSRYIPKGKRKGGPWIKGWGSYLLNIGFATLKRFPCHDLTNSFKMFKKSIIDTIVIESKGFELFMELTLKAYLKGFRVTEVPTIWQERNKGKSKFSLYKDSLRYLFWFIYGLKVIRRRT